MTATSTAPAPPATRPATGSLLRAEAHRISARPFIRALLGLALVLFLVGLFFGARQAGVPDQAAYAEADRRIAAIVAEQERFRQDCLRTPQQGPPGSPELSAEERCGPPTTPESSGLTREQFLPVQPFDLASDLRPGAVAVGVATAALAFLLGATYVGAEWSTRSMVALLFWEPRRLKVVLTKAAVLAATAALVGVAGQLLWAAAAQFLARTRGTTAVPPGFWPDTLAQHGRMVLVCVLLGLLGFGLANLFRNTAAAIGVAFVYLMLVENLVRVFLPGLQPWLLSSNIGALAVEGGLTIPVENVNVTETGELSPVEEIVLSNLHGGLVLAAIVGVVLAAGSALFLRRDLH